MEIPASRMRFGAAVNVWPARPEIRFVCHGLEENPRTAGNDGVPLQ
jgi:hypothetical protein